MKNKGKKCLVALLVVLMACGTISPLVIALEGVVAAATAAQILDSSNPLVTQWAGIAIADCQQVISLVETGPITPAMRQQIEQIFSNSIPDPSIKAIVGAAFALIEAFLGQLANSVPKNGKGVVKLTVKDRAKLDQISKKLADARTHLNARGH